MSSRSHVDLCCPSRRGLVPLVVRFVRVRVSRAPLAALLLSMSTIWLGAVLPSTASASSCPNAAFRISLSAHLPDCRAYEQVSPPEKDGADATLMTTLLPARASAPPEGSAVPVQVSAPLEGSSLAYMSLGSFEGPAGSEVPNAYLSSRDENGWQTQSLTPPTPEATPPGLAPLGYDFSPDLSQFVLKVPLQNLPPQAPETPAGVYNLYVAHPNSSGYSLVTTLPPSASICDECFNSKDVSAFAGASSDFSHIIFEANESLISGAPLAPTNNLYESAGGQVHLVGILPDGTIAAGGSEPGAGISPFYSALSRAIEDQDVNHAISADGSRIVFQATADGGVPDPTQSGMTELYDRIGGSSTIEISAPAEGATPANSTPEPARFWAASADGSLVFFTSSAELTTQSNTGAGNASEDLYQYDVNTGALTDLTVDSNPADASSGAGVLGVVGASEDGSYVYFAAKGQLEPGKGVDGQPNLYLSHAGRVSFIATLSAGDEHDWSMFPAELQAYVTPDGSHLAFMSVNSLTAYDNHDQRTNEPDSEVYEYSAETDGLVCASCDPGGARPTGSAFIGARLDEWTSTPFYQPRALSDDGSRLFFSSMDPLVSTATNSHLNVFEYEDGSVYLISSGTSSSDDVFLDASPSGNDVFFATRQSLTPSDGDELVDIYDARVGGGFPSPTPPVPCSGSVCQGQSSAPPLLPSALSETFAGAGDLPAVSATPPVQATKKSKPLKKKKKKKKKKPTSRKHTRRAHGKDRKPKGKKSRTAAVNHRRSR
jgi:hypothetical protein